MENRKAIYENSIYHTINNLIGNDKYDLFVLRFIKDCYGGIPKSKIEISEIPEDITWWNYIHPVSLKQSYYWFHVGMDKELIEKINKEKNTTP